MAQIAMEPGSLPPPHQLNPVKGADGIWRLDRVRHRAFNGTYVRSSGSGRTKKECLAAWNDAFERNRRKGSAGTGASRQTLKLSDKMIRAFDAYYTQQEKKAQIGKITEQSLTAAHRAIYLGEGPTSNPDALKLCKTLGQLSIGEVGKPAFLADYLESMGDVFPGIAGHHYTVLSGTFKMLTLAGLFDYSPMLPVTRPPAGGGGQRALTASERDELYRVVSTRAKRATYLAPLTLLILGTGMRIGEALAVRWCDVARFEDGKVKVIDTLHVCGTMVARRGEYVRQPYRKSRKRSKVANDFYLTLPSWLVDVLQEWSSRAVKVSPENTLFISLMGGSVRLSTAGDALMDAREGTSVEWVKFGNLRDTVATHVAGVTGDPASASAQLGHSKGVTVAMRHYIDENGYTRPAVDHSEALELLRPSKLGTK
ncbi:tyrosine-type recombinase/integrase [Nocardia brasiliensis]|uniref:tyrosine-type recombinase/integrase n=1 Tax=Nocardia brasiliensis TaxID=37326 RepID=UPI002458493D|nr:tyrosine-type recombinase/integrase [Nocardia brasiliensis]